MATPIPSLNQEQKSNAALLLAAMAAYGITNNFAKLALLGNVYKECGLFCVKERVENYPNASNERLRKLFGSRLPKSDADLDALKRQGTYALIDAVYGGQFGKRNFDNDPNVKGPKSDANVFIGRGFIQLTGKSQYISYGRELGVDLFNNPDLMLTKNIAAKQTILYLLKRVSGGASGLNSFTNQDQANRELTTAIGGRNILASPIGEELLAKVTQYANDLGTKFNILSLPPAELGALSAAVGAPINTPLPTVMVNAFEAYYKKVYVDPISSKGGKEEEITKALKEGKIFAKSPGGELRTLQDIVRDTAIYDTGPNSLDGELKLLGSISQVGQEYKNERSSILNRVDGLLPAEAVFLVQNKLFEFYPDLMRQKMSENTKGDGYNANYSHAWRSPGKLAVTADITIPGVSGFRVGQVFWVGRNYDVYKKFGAFQLFGLTETIDISKGWTTEIHSRFNVMPSRKLQGLESE